MKRKTDKPKDIIKEELIKIPIYFAQSDEGTIWIDEDSIYEELRNKLSDITKNPSKYLEI